MRTVHSVHHPRSRRRERLSFVIELCCLITHHSTPSPISIRNTMESHKPRASQSQRDRQRSRSPSGSRLETAAEPTFRTGRGARWRSQRHFQEVLDEVKANKEKWAAEEERHRNLPPAERLKEDGQGLLRQLEDSDRMVFLLQETPRDTSVGRDAGPKTAFTSRWKTRMVATSRRIIVFVSTRARLMTENITITLYASTG
jgi:hypothetical protein